MLDQVPDSIKVAGAVSAPVLTFLGITVEDWTYILSAIVSFMFIVEKMPIFIFKMRMFIKWMREVYKSFKG